MTEVILHGFPVSSNTHRVRLMLGLLDVPFEERIVNLVTGEQLAPAYSAINPRQRVPALEHNGRILVESYAILIYLVQAFGGKHRAAWWPVEPAAQASVASWLYYSANELHNGIGLARNEHAFGLPSGGEFALDRAKASLKLLNAHMTARDWLEENRPTLADVAVYPFIAVASEANLDLARYPALGTWLARVEALPGAIRMPLLRDLRK